MDQRNERKRLANALLLNGYIPATVLDEIAALMGLDDVVGDGCHSSRSWMRSLKRDINMPGLYYTKLPMATGERMHPFRLPSVKARELWQKDPEHFNLKYRHVPGRVETSGNWRQHPLFKQAGLQAVPKSFYGDGVQYVVNKHGKQDSLVCLYFAFPHRLPGNAGGHDADWMENIHVFTVVRKADLNKQVLDAIWDVLAWDMQAMSTGKFAGKRHDKCDLEKGSYLAAMKGQFIAGGARFAIVQMKQDWEYLCSVFGFKTWSAKEFCPFCEAPRDPQTWVRDGARAAWRTTIWDHTKLTKALRDEVRLAEGSVSTKMKFASHMWGIPHMNIAYIKCDPMHVLYCDGVVNKVIGCLLYQMTIARKDFPGRTIDDRVAAAWEGIREFYKPKSPPTKELTVNTFRPTGGDGLATASFRAKAKQTWDTWPAVQHLVEQYSTNDTEKQIAHFLGELNSMMKLHHLDEKCGLRWLTSEVNFLSLWIGAGFPTTPKFHMLQHIYKQFEFDCAPRYSYCFAEETKNAKMADLAKKACNKDGLAEKVLLMHELWSASGNPTLPSIKRQRVAKRPAAVAPVASAKRSADVDVDSSSSAGAVIESDSEVDIDVA